MMSDDRKRERLERLSSEGDVEADIEDLVFESIAEELLEVYALGSNFNQDMDYGEEPSVYKKWYQGVDHKNLAKEYNHEELQKMAEYVDDMMLLATVSHFSSNSKTYWDGSSFHLGKLKKSIKTDKQQIQPGFVITEHNPAWGVRVYAGSFDTEEEALQWVSEYLSWKSASNKTMGIRTSSDYTTSDINKYTPLMEVGQVTSLKTSETPEEPATKQDLEDEMGDLKAKIEDMEAESGAEKPKSSPFSTYLEEDMGDQRPRYGPTSFVSRPGEDQPDPGHHPEDLLKKMKEKLDKLQTG